MVYYNRRSKGIGGDMPKVSDEIVEIVLLGVQIAGFVNWMEDKEHRIVNNDNKTLSEEELNNLINEYITEGVDE